MKRYNGGMFNPDDPQEMTRAKQKLKHVEEKELIEERLAIQADIVAPEILTVAKQIPVEAKKMIERFKKELLEKREADAREASMQQQKALPGQPSRKGTA